MQLQWTIVYLQYTIYRALYMSCIPVAARMARLSLHPVPKHKSEANGFCLLWAPSKAAQAWASEAFLPLHWFVWRRQAVFWEKQKLAAAGDGEQKAQPWGCEISHGPHICREEEEHLEWWSDGSGTVYGVSFLEEGYVCKLFLYWSCCFIAKSLTC